MSADVVDRLMQVAKDCQAQRCNLAYAARNLIDAAVEIAALQVQVEKLQAALAEREEPKP